MKQTNEAVTAEIPVSVARDAVKDTGAVRFGSGCIHFSDAPAREATKDTGRVRMGSGCIQF